MTKREQIFGILNKHFGYSTAINTTAEISYQLEKINKCIDAILALPLDVPSDKEIEGEAMTYSSYPAMPDGHPEFEPSRATDFDAGAKWMKEEIIKRNK